MKKVTEQQVEKLLRAERGSMLSSEFKAELMAKIKAMPTPAQIKPASTWRDILYGFNLLGPAGKLAAAAIVLGIIAMFLPGASEWLAAIDWELSGRTVDVSIGETAVSASLMSTVTVSAGLLFVAWAGYYGTRGNLVSA